MIFKELAELKLKDFPEGIWVHFHNNINDYHYYDEKYLDNTFLEDLDFKDLLNKEVKNYYIDECGYDLLEVELEWKEEK